MDNEMPVMGACGYSSTQFDARQFLGERIGNALNQAANIGGLSLGQYAANQLQQQKGNVMASARIVKVFIADANENIPLENRVLHSGEEKLTDLTDQELFFEVPINDLLAKHNEYRKKVTDKVQSEKFGRDIFLEAARIRDLKMIVVTVAQF